jgi:ESCRT-I complex subunit VPS28
MYNSKWPKSLDESLPEIELYSSARERNEYENMAALYTIIIATEHLERAYAQDAITQQEYVTECNKLLGHFKIAEKAALGGGEKTGMTTEAFMKLYQMDCPRAAHRLMRMGVPEPIKVATAGDAARAAVIIAETVQHFITTMDAVKLEQRAVDELQPLLSDLLNALVQLPDTPNGFSPNNKVKKWLERLNAMRAVDMIGEDDARQLYLDLDSAYSDFSRYLRAKT